MASGVQFGGEPVVGGVAVDPQALVPPNYKRLTFYTDWRDTWTQIVAGKFFSSHYSGLLFYEQSNGYAEFYETSGSGGISLAQTHSDWRNSWTHIVPCQFGASPFTGLLFYDRQAGFAATYASDGAGNIHKLQEYDTWGTSWTHIVAFRMLGSGSSGFALYDREAGYVEVLVSDANGKLTLLGSNSDLSTSWTKIVGGDFNSNAQLFVYDETTSRGELYSIDGTGKLAPAMFADGVPAAADTLPPATHVIPGNFGWYGTSLLFYNRPTGSAAFIDYNPPQIGDGPQGFVLDGAETYDNWRTTWDIIVPGEFWLADSEDYKFDNGFTDLLFYDRQNGYGEFYLHEPFGSILLNPLDGFASPGSVVQGGTISFYVNSRVGPYSMKVYRQDADEVLMTTLGQEASPVPQPYPIGRLDWRDGPKWPVAANLTVPQDWPSGLYVVRVEPIKIVAPPGPNIAEGARGSIAASGGPGAAPDIPSVARRTSQLQLLNESSGRPRGPIRLGAVARVSSPSARGRTIDMQPNPPKADALRPRVTGSGTYLDIPFVVRTAVPGSQSKILLYISDTTYNAYNFWGGRSLYGFRSRGYRVWSLGTNSSSPQDPLPRAFYVSCLRPYDALPDPEAGDFPALNLPPEKNWQFWEVPMISWLARQGIMIEVCTATDLHDNQELLQGYRLLVSIGHDEYWTKEMRDQVEGFTSKGGNVVFFSGNVCWWQSRLEKNAQNLVCYKNGNSDPISSSHPQLATVNWYDKPINRSETSMTGVSYFPGVVWPDDVSLQQFHVNEGQAGHWAFANTGLQESDRFGQYIDSGYVRTTVGTETDGFQPSGPVEGTNVEVIPRSPQGFVRLASIYDAQQIERGTMGTFTNNGTVFAVGTINWCLGLSPAGNWSVIDQISLNVLEQLK